MPIFKIVVLGEFVLLALILLYEFYFILFHNYALIIIHYFHRGTRLW